jgi:hypothetical protein
VLFTCVTLVGCADPVPDAYNLMQSGTHLTQGQIAVLRLSPLLRHPDDPS